MKREKVNKILDSELSHINKGTIGSLQSHLRFCYYDLREGDLAKKSPKGRNVVLGKAIIQLQKRNPDFVANFDKIFFK